MIRTLPQGTHVLFNSDDPDDVFHMTGRGAVIVNPNRAPRFVDTEGNVRDLVPDERSRWELWLVPPR